MPGTHCDTSAALKAKRAVADGSRRATLISLGLSAALLAALYRTIDARLMLALLRAVDPLWLLVSVGMIVPITWLRAVRFYLVTPKGLLPGVVEALRLTLVSSAANVFMPASTGDLVKSYFVAKRGGGSASVSIAVVAYERLSDLFGLNTWCVLGWLIVRPVVPGAPAWVWPMLGGIAVICGVLIWSERVARLCKTMLVSPLVGRFPRVSTLADGWPDVIASLRPRRGRIAALSLLLWFLHLFQIWMFTLALSMHVPFAVSASLSAIALMAGQLPFAFGGLGARDVALVLLLKNYARPESAAALGLLIATRNLLPPLAALPIVRPYAAALALDLRPGSRSTPR
jgi:uncharacterized membrane protein YbhN (UPF0104 family)